MPISKIPVGAIQSGTIGTSQIADNAVTTAKILNDNVTSAKIVDNAVDTSEIASNAVTRDELQSAAVNNISSDSIILNSTNGTADAGDFLVLDGTDGSSSNANHRILYDETFNPSTFNVSGTATAGNAIKVASGGGFEFGEAGAGNVMEILSSPCNGTQVTVSSGTYTFPDVTSAQANTTSYADVTGSSITYTPPSGTTRVIYKFYSQISYDANFHATHIKFFLDGSEVTDGRRTFYGNYLAGGLTYEYTINCNASGASTAHGDITSWTTPKVMKLQAREYDSGNQSVFHKLKLWDGTSSSDVVVPILTITSLKET